MVKSEQQRQRKIAKKNTKERQKRNELVRHKQELASLSGKMSFASRGRVIHCSIADSVASSGIGGVSIFREAPGGMIAMAIFLVDTCCLGVKDVTAALATPASARTHLANMRERGATDASIGEAIGLIERAVEYGRQNGFEPHPDYRKVTPIWGIAEAEDIDGQYEFGRDGKPFFVNGPFDDAARCRHIINTLQAKVGIGNFDYMIGGPAGTLGALLGTTLLPAGSEQ